MNLSVVVITANRTSVFRRCVETLRVELHAGDEVIGVTGSQPPLECAMVAEFSPLLQVIVSDRMCMPYQRNLGIMAARQAVVAFVDDDAFVQPGWRDEILRLYENPDVAGVCGREILKGYEQIETLALPGMGKLGRLRGLQHYAGTEIMPVRYGQGCNMSFRKQVLEEVGMFDSSYTLKATCEESDLFERFYHLGHRILYNPQAVVIHEQAAPFGYSRSMLDRRTVFSTNRNLAYFYFKHFLFGAESWAWLLLHSLDSFWRYLRHAVLVVFHTLFLLCLSFAGIVTGIGLALRWHLGGKRS
jgi:GT2 family glycosyltransferase